MKEMRQFDNFMKWTDSHGLKPYRAEWPLFHEPSQTAGTIDSIWVNDEGEYIMIDWKRVPPNEYGGGMSGSDVAFANRKGFQMCSHMPDTKFSHYAVQQNLYAEILEQRYDFRLTQMYLCQIHPLLSEFLLIQVPRMEEMSKKMLEIESKEFEELQKMEKMEKMEN